MKLKSFQKILKDKGIDQAIFFHPDPSITYFSQFVPSSGFLLIKPRNASLFITSLDSKPQMKYISTVILKKGWEKQLKDVKVKKVGINKSALCLKTFEKLKTYFPKAKFVDLAKEVQELRALKTEPEINKLSKACKITSNAFENLIDNIKKLKTEQDVAFFLEKQIKDNQGTIAFPIISATGRNAAIPHHVTSNQKLCHGFLLLDFGAAYQNYNADMTRVLFLGKLSEEEKQAYQQLLEAQECTLDQIKENNSFVELDTFCRNKLGKQAKSFTHSLGHGIGVEVHEEPFFQEGRKITKNQVFTIEPGVYFPRKFGLRIEDTLVFSGINKILTTAPKELVKVKF